MTRTTVKKTVEISSAHWLPFHGGKCRGLHGHNYIFEVSVTGEVNLGTNFVVDFGDLKSAINETVGIWDHKLLTHFPLAEAFESDFARLLEGGVLGVIGVKSIGDVVFLGEFTTAENLSRIAARSVGIRMPLWIDEVSVVVWETSTSSAETCLIRVGDSWESPSLLKSWPEGMLNRLSLEE